MPRQTFATREFFVNTCESTAQQAVLDLPRFFKKIQFVTVHAKLHAMAFFYEQEGASFPIKIAVSVLPLNDSHTKVTVHGSYTNGCAFYNDPYVTNAVSNVEAALHAVINGEGASFQPMVPKKKVSQRVHQWRGNAVTYLSTLYKGRNVLKPFLSWPSRT